MDTKFFIVATIIAAGMILSVALKKLTLPGAVSGALIGFLIYDGAGITGLVMMTIFFVLAVLATHWKVGYKEQMHFAERNKGMRNAGQVWANAGAAALFAVCIILSRDLHLVILVAACFASATADTLSSELGTVYGKRFYNILNLKPDQKGLDGVISAEGTLIGIAGSAIIALVYVLGLGWSPAFYIILIAGTAGNVLDSILGATAERKGIIDNNMVNFLNTLFAAAVAEVLYMVMIA